MTVMHKNNFDFLRLLFAVFVMITHSYSLSGQNECDWLCSVSNEQTLFSSIGVKAFFILSGYLIFQSLMRSKSVIDYFWKRVLRLYPALIVVLVLTILIGPLFYYNPGVPYLKNVQVWTYIPRNLALFVPQFKITGMFEGNPYPSVINGTLWTIHYEFAMYCALALLWQIRSKQTTILVVLSGTYFTLLLINLFFLNGPGIDLIVLNTNAVANLGVFFMAGALLATINIGQIKYLKLVTLGSAVVLAASLAFGNYFHPLHFVLLPILVIGLGLQKTPFLSEIGNKIGDLSYGIYIYGFLVQQILVHYFNLDYQLLLLYSLIITAILSYLSWHYVEVVFLRFKKLDVGRLISTGKPRFLTNNRG